MNKKWSIKKKLLISTSFLIFISVMLVTIVSSRNYKKDMIELSYKDTKITLQQLANNIETYLKAFQELCIVPYYDVELIDTLSTEPEDSVQILKKQRIIEAFLSKNILLPNDDIKDAYIFTNKELYSSKRTQNYISNSTLSPELIKKVKESKFPLVIYPKDEDFSFTILSNILDMKDNSKSLGIMQIDANSKGIDRICSKVLDSVGKSLIITNENNSMIYSASKVYSDKYLYTIHNQLLKTNLDKSNIISVDKTEFLISSITIPLTSWTIYDISNLELLTKGINEIQTRSIFLGLICATIGIILSTQLVRLLLKPIYEVTDLMKKVQKEDYSVKAIVKGDDEIAYLSSTFNEMTEKIDSTMKKNILLTQQIYEAKYLEKEAQYVAMCNQIKPHFLFNSLNTISLLIKVNRKKESIDYIEKLATLLNALVHSNSEITLRSEILLCKNYLSMQCIRYTNLDYEIKINESHFDYLLPALTIQPIVENALVHGFSRKTDKCHIIIKSAEDKNSILIQIEDNGKGMTVEELHELRNRINSPTIANEGSNKRVALININRRIKLKYGNEYGLTFSSSQDIGSIFTLKIPKKNGENDV